MKLSYSRLNLSISFEEENLFFLSIENPTLLYQLLKDFYEYDDTVITVSENDVPLKLSKSICLIESIFTIDLTAKKLVTSFRDHINSQVINTEEFNELFLKFYNSYLDILKAIRLRSDISFEYEEKISIKSLLDFANVKPASKEVSLVENLLLFIKHSSLIFGTVLYVFPFLNSFLIK